MTEASASQSFRLDPGTPPSDQSAPWFGRRWEHQQAIIAAIGSLFACWLYLLGTRKWAPDRTPGTVEFLATAASLWSVWITQRRNVLAMPVGIVSVVLMGWFFKDIGLVGQTWLQWGYYLPVQFWAWQQWTRGGESQSELRVTRLAKTQWIFIATAGVVGTVVLGWVLNAGWENALHTYWDASIVAASVLAMLLLSRKKVESWWLWIGPVNVSAVGLYLSTGAYMFAALYGLFLVMAGVALGKWIRANKAGAA